MDHENQRNKRSPKKKPYVITVTVVNTVQVTVKEHSPGEAIGAVSNLSFVSVIVPLDEDVTAFCVDSHMVQSQSSGGSIYIPGIRIKETS